MALEVDLVARLAAGLAAEEVVEADLVQRRGRGVGGDMAADADLGPVRAVHHDGGVPPDVGTDPALGVLVAREPRFSFGWNRVDVVRAAQAGYADLLLAGTLEKSEHEVARPPPALLVDDRVERLQPLVGLARVDVR